MAQNYSKNSFVKGTQIVNQRKKRKSNCHTNAN